MLWVFGNNLESIIREIETSSHRAKSIYAGNRQTIFIDFENYVWVAGINNSGLVTQTQLDNSVGSISKRRRSVSEINIHSSLISSRTSTDSSGWVIGITETNQFRFLESRQRK
uniref:Uncharacterized protein n=1 Tax=viral metagenome TaxID=1070528 RepID=A0A6C0IYW6_9ZZZZ